MTEPKDPTITVSDTDVTAADGGAALDSELDQVSGGAKTDAFLKIEGGKSEGTDDKFQGRW
jgi:hypothetical protein